MSVEEFLSTKKAPDVLEFDESYTELEVKENTDMELNSPSPSASTSKAKSNQKSKSKKDEREKDYNDATGSQREYTT